MSICQEADEVYGVRPEDIPKLNIGGWSIIKELFCGVWELLHHGIPDYRASNNREATIRFRRVALSNALSYSVQRERLTCLIGGVGVERTTGGAAYAVTQPGESHTWGQIPFDKPKLISDS